MHCRPSKHEDLNESFFLLQLWALYGSIAMASLLTFSIVALLVRFCFPISKPSPKTHTRLHDELCELLFQTYFIVKYFTQETLSVLMLCAPNKRQWTSSIFLFCPFSREKDWQTQISVLNMASSDSQIDEPQGGRPKRAELPDVNTNTGVQSINTERASLTHTAPPSRLAAVRGKQERFLINPLFIF